MNKTFEKITEIVEYFHQELKKSSIAKEYLKSRGVSKDSVITFKLGYAPIKVPYFAQRFSNRIIFPFCNNSGTFVGWTSRVLQEEIKNKKYLNTHDSPEFKKSRLLYGYHLAVKEIFKKQQAILVEGQMDVILLHQAGFINTVATSGGTLKEVGARSIARYAKYCYLVFDNDDNNAGKKASLTAEKCLKDVGVTTFPVVLPEGEDPASFILTQGPDKFRKLLENARK